MTDLNKLYSPSRYNKRFSADEVYRYHLEFIENANNSVVKQLQCELNIPYGDTERQKIDIFGTDLAQDSPIFIYIHGGYWQVSGLSRSSYHFVAKNLHNHNIKTIFIGYDLCPKVTIAQIITQVETAIKQCLQYATKHKSKGVYLMGHSAGAHLVASLFTSFVLSLSENERLLVKGAFLVSGIFDLTTLQKTEYNEALKMDERVALEMSPLKLSLFYNDATVFYVFVGENESPEFIRQAKEFGEKLEKSGYRVKCTVLADIDHYNIVENLSDEEFELTQCLIGTITEDTM